MSEYGGGMLRQIKPGRFRIEHPLVVNEKDGSVLVYVPVGEFEMGDGQDKDCPPHRVSLSAYWIGVYCVTNAQYRKFVEATGYRAADDGRYREGKLADHPVVNVSWDDAVAYANWAGCGLPSEAQWEKAARGPLGLIYPWGKEWDGTKCRHSGNRGNEETARVYDYPTGASGYGTYNQSGNVWEWCVDWYDGGYYGKSLAQDPRGPDGGSIRANRGGSCGPSAPSDYRAAGYGRYLSVLRYDFRGFSSREASILSPCLPSEFFRRSALAGRRRSPAGEKRRRSRQRRSAGLCGDGVGG